MKNAENDYEKTAEELELLEEELKESEGRRVIVSDELDEVKEEMIRLKVASSPSSSALLIHNFHHLLLHPHHCHPSALLTTINILTHLHLH